MSTLHQRINIDATFGACFIGAQISVMLYGLSTLQSYFYFVSYPGDLKKNKALVSIIWFLDTLHVALVSVFLYHHLVTNYDNPPSLAVYHWLLSMSLATNIVLAFFVKCFFAMQIFQLASSRVRWWLTSIIGFSIVACASFGIGTFVLTIIKKRLAGFSHSTLFVSMPFVVFAILSDVLIAGSLCVLLQRNRTGNRKTNTVITTLIVYAINRCLLTTAVSIVESIVFQALPNSLWAFAVDFVIGKLYSNSLLAALNSRQAIRATITGTSHISNIAFVESTDLTTNVRPRAASRPLILEESTAGIRSSSDAPVHSSVDVHMTIDQGQDIV